MRHTVNLPPLPTFDSTRLLINDIPYSTLVPRLERIRTRLRITDPENNIRYDPTNFDLVNRPKLGRSADELLGHRLLSFFYED